jgi:hypothetical protein
MATEQELDDLRTIAMGTTLVKALPSKYVIDLQLANKNHLSIEDQSILMEALQVLEIKPLLQDLYKISFPTEVISASVFDVINRVREAHKRLCGENG